MGRPNRPIMPKPVSPINTASNIASDMPKNTDTKTMEREARSTGLPVDKTGNSPNLPDAPKVSGDGDGTPEGT